MKSFLLLSALIVGGAAANAQIVIDQQPTDYGNGREGDVSDNFSDQTTLSTYGFDDFVMPVASHLTSITAYGVELGVPGGTIHMRIVQNANHIAPGIVFLDVAHTGGEVAGDWTVTSELVGHDLNVGNFWMEIWVDRNFTTQGQWQWANSSPSGGGTRGSESKLHNPGGGFGFGTNPIPASQTGLHGPRDNAFRIIAVPEPATLVAIGTGLAALAARRRK